MIEAPHEEPDIHDPMAEALRRASRRGAAIDVLVRDVGDPGLVGEIGEGLVALARKAGHEAAWRTLSADPEIGEGAALRAAIEATSAPLVLVTTAVEPWTEAHLRPLLEAIEKADHALGRRPLAGRALWEARAARLARSLLFAIPVLDVHTPCRLHRREALAAIPLQSESCYAEVELLAKATFLGQILEEVDVPRLAADDDPRRRALWAHDRGDVWRRPTFRVEPAPVSGPAEDPQREEERADGPGGEDEQVRDQRAQAGALQDDGAEGRGELGEG